MDIDQSARLTNAQKRERVTFVQTQKKGQKCRGWSVAFCAGEVIDQERQSWVQNCIDDFKQRYQTVLRVLGRIEYHRGDGGYYR